jgi:glutaminyl-tRNA synthetase
LRWACVVRCTGVVKDDAGRIVEVRCTYDEASRGGNPADGRKIKATIHWVSAAHAIEAEARLYDRLFLVDDPAGDDWLEHLNPASCERLRGCKLEPSLATANVRERYQFERLGYFCLDETASTPAAPVFNRTVTLRDAWARVQKAGLA